MTDDDLTRLRELADAATPGPWRYGEDLFITGFLGIAGPDDGWIVEDFGPVCRYDKENDENIYDAEPDAAFIAAARDAVPALLDALADARAARDIAQAEAAALRHERDRLAAALRAEREYVRELPDDA